MKQVIEIRSLLVYARILCKVQLYQCTMIKKEHNYQKYILVQRGEISHFHEARQLNPRRGWHWVGHHNDSLLFYVSHHLSPCLFYSDLRAAISADLAVTFLLRACCFFHVRCTDCYVGVTGVWGKQYRNFTVACMYPRTLPNLKTSVTRPCKARRRMALECRET